MQGPSFRLHHWIFPGALALAAVAVALAGDGAADLLRLERGAVTSEPWRLLTGHLAHLSESHLLLNVAGLALVWLLVGSAFRNAEWWLVGLLIALTTSAALLWIGGLDWYVGLSGLLHGLLVAGALRLALSGDRDSWLILVVVSGKLVWEQWAGPLPGSVQAAGGPVVVDAHLYGGLAGTAAALLAAAGRRRFRLGS